MKINKIILGLALAVSGLFTSCDTDNEGATFSSDNEGLSFSSSVLSDITVSPADPTFEVEIIRGNSEGSLSGTVSISGTIKKQPFTNVTVTGYTFQAGETITTVKVDVSALQIGQELKLELSIDDVDNISVGGNATASMTASKDYNWVSLGKGTFTDNWGWAGFTYSCEILKADGFDRWRILEPYVQSEAQDDGKWEDWLAKGSAPYIEFWKTDDGVVNFSKFYTGINYQGDKDSPIWCYPPTAFNIDPSFNKFIDSKTVQLAPYYYVPSLQGGWNNTQENGVIVITLP